MDRFTVESIISNYPGEYRDRDEVQDVFDRHGAADPYRVINGRAKR
jgi:hypothetical protein